MKGAIRSLEATYFVHATEDPVKIQRAVSKLLGSGVSPETEELEGHFGNTIVKARVHLTGAEAERGFEQLVASLPAGVVDEIASDVWAHLDEHSALFVRLDKQRLVSGAPALGTGDSVRIKAKPKAFLIRGGAAQFYRELLGRR